MKKEIKREFPESLYRLLGEYRPVQNDHDATHFFSTEQISEALEEHTGEQISFNQLFSELKSMGFTYGVKGDLNLTWLLQKKE